LSLPNYITFLRIVLVPFFFTELLSYRPGQEHHRLLAISIFIFASFTDALDGAIARLTKSKTELGTFLDPLADKLLLLSGYLAILGVESLTYRPPLWITVTIVFRDIMISVGLIVIYFISGRVQVAPNFLGKCTTASQMLTLIAILFMWPHSYLLWNLTAGLTMASFFVYFRRELNKLKPS
jgi:cardiolipin synthase (CMP-forming)